MFLRLKDYERSIQLTELAEMLKAGGDSVRLSNELGTLEEVQSYLRQRYDVTEEFADLNPFAVAKTYLAETLVELNGAPYNPQTAYTAASKAIVLYLTKIYYCSTDTTGAFNASDWTLLGSQYDLFYVTLPAPEFNINSLYNAKDLVFWKEKVYQATKSSPTLDEQTQIQYLQYSRIPPRNVFPDDPNNGLTFWGVGVPFSVAGLTPANVVGDFTAWSALTSYTGVEKATLNGVIYQSIAASLNVTPGTNITKWLPISWTAGDNRNQKMVEVMVDVAIYKTNKQIAPRNITQARIDAYHLAIEWLEMARKGEVMTMLPEIQPDSGRRIRFGGNIKVQNNY